jgi:DNA-binding transcriptional ArsR family regulator
LHAREPRGVGGGNGGVSRSGEWGEGEASIVNVAALEDSARRASGLLKAMGNPHRLMILCQLLSGEKKVSELERLVGLSQSALSQHLARLRRDELVKTRRAAQVIYYSLAGEEATAIITTLHHLYCGPAEDAQAVAVPADDRPLDRVAAP